MISLLGLVLILNTTPMSHAAEEVTDDASGQGVENSNPQLPGEVPGAELYGENTAVASHPLSVNYFGIFYGPSLENPTGYQPNSRGLADYDHPVMFKNFLGPGYNLSDEVALSGVCVWTWEPLSTDQLQLQDPFLKLSDRTLIHSGNLNVYGDIRVHFPANVPGENGFALGLQNVEAMTYEIEGTRLTLGTNFSVRRNFFGGHGVGDDLELYLAPNLSYQLSPTLAVTLLWEIARNHTVGTLSDGEVIPVSSTNHYGTDIEPGVNWDITPQLWINPYLNFLPGSPINMKSMSFGMMLGWVLI